MHCFGMSHKRKNVCVDVPNTIGQHRQEILPCCFYLLNTEPNIFLSHHIPDVIVQPILSMYVRPEIYYFAITFPTI